MRNLSQETEINFHFLFLLTIDLFSFFFKLLGFRGLISIDVRRDKLKDKFALYT